jgi:hypothetical protein
MTDQAGNRLALPYRRSERMVGRHIADEYLVVPIVGRGADLDSIYHLNGVGAFIWQRLDGKTVGHVIVEAIVERYEVTRERARRDYVQFIEQLESIGAVSHAA